MMEYRQAKRIADEWLERLQPYCERVEIAGSVRRKKENVHDIELVAIPKTAVEMDMFGFVIADKNQLEVFIDGCIYMDLCKPVKNGAKYKQLALSEGINLDLFVVRPETWAVQFVIRTGPAEFSHWLVTQRKYGGALPSNCKVHDGQVWKGGKAQAFREEKDFLEFLGLGWIEPQERRAGLSLGVTA